MPAMAYAKAVHSPAELLAGLGLKYGFLEGPTKSDLEVWSGEDIPALRWEDYDKGVLFGETAEVRFRKRRNGTYHLLLVADDPIEAPWQGARELKEVGTSSVILWGEPDSVHGGWYEGRIPRRLPYPFPPSGTKGTRVVAALKHYHLADGGPELRRHVRLECKQFGGVAEV